MHGLCATSGFEDEIDWGFGLIRVGVDELDEPLFSDFIANTVMREPAAQLPFHRHLRLIPESIVTWKK